MKVITWIWPVTLEKELERPKIYVEVEEMYVWSLASRLLVFYLHKWIDSSEREENMEGKNEEV